MRDRSRKLLEVTEVCGFDDNEIITRTLFQWIEGRGLVQTAELQNREKLIRAGVKTEMQPETRLTYTTSFYKTDNLPHRIKCSFEEDILYILLRCNDTRYNFA